MFSFNHFCKVSEYLEKRSINKMYYYYYYYYLTVVQKQQLFYFTRL